MWKLTLGYGTQVLSYWFPYTWLEQLSDYMTFSSPIILSVLNFQPYCKPVTLSSIHHWSQLHVPCCLTFSTSHPQSHKSTLGSSLCGMVVTMDQQKSYACANPLPTHFRPIGVKYLMETFKISNYFQSPRCNKPRIIILGELKFRGFSTTPIDPRPNQSIHA